MIRNERLKLFANWMNIMAGGSFVTGVVAAPLNLWLGRVQTDNLHVAGFVMICVVGSLILHLIGQLFLRWLMP